jgi:hypothetical protein
MKALGPTRVLRAAAIMTTVFGISIAPSQTRAFEPVGNADALGDLGARIVAAEGEPGRNPLSSAAGYGNFCLEPGSKCLGAPIRRLPRQ